MKLTWQKCLGNKWCSLLRLNLSHDHFDGLAGVYIIWQDGGLIIRVGQGEIRGRISKHRSDKQITAYNNLLVTWARVSSWERGGVERFLAEKLNPVIGSKFPDVLPIPVNLPSN